MWKQFGSNYIYDAQTFLVGVLIFLYMSAAVQVTGSHWKLKNLLLSLQGMHPLAVLGFVAYILLSLTVIGMLFDDCPYTCIFELARCLMFVSYIQHSELALQGGSHMSLLQPFFILSCFFWILKTFKFIQVKVKWK